MSVPTRLKSFLEENKVHYTPMSHTPVYTAQAAAAVMHVSGKELAKTTVALAGDEMILAVLPAAAHVNFDKLGKVVGKPVRLASEKEFMDKFPDCETGAMPPFGNLYKLPVYVDQKLAADEEIVFNAGTHRDAIRMRYEDFARLAQPTLGDFADKG